MKNTMTSYEKAEFSNFLHWLGEKKDSEIRSVLQYAEVKESEYDSLGFGSLTEVEGEEISPEREKDIYQKMFLWLSKQKPSVISDAYDHDVVDESAFA